MLCGFLSGQVLVLCTSHFELHDLAVLQVTQSKATRRGDEDVEHRPAQAEPTCLTWEAANHLRSPTDFLERSLQQVRGAEPLAWAGKVRQVRAQRRQDLRQAGRGT